MSTWRRKAIAAFPEFREKIEHSHSPMALWIELWIEFEHAFAGGNMTLVPRITTYARYCLASSDGNVRTAAALGFIEHLPTNNAVQAAIPDLLTLREVRDLRSILAYHVGEKIVADIEQKCQLRIKNPPPPRRH